MTPKHAREASHSELTTCLPSPDLLSSKNRVGKGAVTLLLESQVTPSKLLMLRAHVVTEDC